MIIPSEIIDDYLKKGWITVRYHPDWNLRIINYTPEVQYGGHWNRWTKMFRGLIVDRDGRIVSRPFEKFFNLEEISPDVIPKENPVSITNKLDGSLGISYFVNGEMFIATRGSFTSDQAMEANEMLVTCGLDRYINSLRMDYTYLFEIIYPENRVVVDYGKERMLVLIGVINTETGEIINRSDWPKWPSSAFEYDTDVDVHNLRNAYPGDNREGFVVRWANGFMVKLKYEGYVKLHRIMTGLTRKKIWEMLSSGEDIEETCRIVPEEVANLIRKEAYEFKEAYDQIIKEADRVSKEMRKMVALHIEGHRYSPVIFNMLFGGNYNKFIWKQLKPKGDEGNIYEGSSGVRKDDMG